MRYDEQCRGVFEDGAQGDFHVLGIEGTEAFVEDDQIGLLQEGTSDVDAAAFAVGEVPADSHSR